MNKKALTGVTFILFIGIIYRLFLTSNGNFLFNMDNGRDMVDVREMVILKKIRLSGPNSAIEGLYNGPAWYYLLAIPFIISGGNPYASIIMEIILWALGGFFLLKVVTRWGRVLIMPIGAIWVASNYIVLTNLYAFNPNPILLLTPVLIYFLVEYLQNGKLINGILTWLLAGLFFNFEMNLGIFMPAIILVSVIFNNRIKLLKEQSFWIGVGIFIVTLLPQIIFDLKHHFIMSKSVVNFLLWGNHSSTNLITRFQSISLSFYNVFVPTLLNHKILSLVILGLFGLSILKRWKTKVNKNIVVSTSFIFILVPFLGYLFIPVTVNPWHLGAEMAASLILIGFLLKEIWDFNIFGKAVSIVLFGLIMVYAALNISSFFIYEYGKKSMDPSVYKNEIAAIDYVYQKAQGKNFKVYTYLPSVYDYPYQYLIWWYGLKKFGYLPKDYAYAPNKPPYISNKESFSAKIKDLKRQDNSDLVFLIKEPNQNYTLFGWEGDFVKLKSMERQMVGPLEIEVKKESTE